MASVERITALSDRHARQRDSILEKLIRLLFGLWDGFDRVDDHGAVIGMAARSATLTQSAADQARRNERSYLTAQFRELGVSTRNLPEMQSGPVRLSVDPLEVWQRPVEQWIWQRRQESSLEEQRAALRDRVQSLGGADVLVAARDEASSLYESREAIVGYRRIIHPELSRSGTCGLCVVAAGRLYHSGDLSPIHGSTCNCDTVGVTSGFDPGFRLNEDDLQKVYAAAGSNGAAELLNTRISIDEHGELGPVLVKQGDHFRTPEEAGRPAYMPRTPQNVAEARSRNRESATTELAQLERDYAEFESQHPESLSPDGPRDLVGQRIALFRSLRYLRDYAKALERLPS